MAFRSFKPKRERGPNEPQSPFVEVTALIPRPLYNKLKANSIEKEIPQSRLLTMALFNELETGDPFNFIIPFPEEEYIEGKYAAESEKLMGLINQFNKGVGLDMLIMSKDGIGFTTDQIMSAYRELVETDQISTSHPAEIGIPGHYKKDYFHVRMKSKQLTSKEIKNNRNSQKAPLNDLIPKKQK